MTKLPIVLDKSNIKEFLDRFDTILTDCDGVIWNGHNVIDKANETIKTFKNLGKRVIYVTNNCTLTREVMLKKLEKLDFPGAKEDIATPAYTVAQYLKDLNFDKKAYVLGLEGIIHELDDVGIPHSTIGPDVIKNELYEVGPAVQEELDSDVGAVVVGFDFHFSFPKIIKASTYINSNPSCLFLALAGDENFQDPKTNLTWPCTGALVKCISTVVEKEPILIGKPATKMYDIMEKHFKFDPNRTLMIGDRGNTDILFGKNCGLTTLLVLSGVTQLSDCEAWAASKDPEAHRLLADYYLPSLGALRNLLQVANGCSL
ncbi:unnamed protein product [Meganyctiphanes norvegica]|uniref:Phosphoglycolate phosphatase n=1 Tax=Meganyctiphanes norvegica TaxID=48144 RepID=A0AAV2S450_MEGNR